MSQNESTAFLVTDSKNLTLIDATRENSPWWNAVKATSASQGENTTKVLQYSFNSTMMDYNS